MKQRFGAFVLDYFQPVPIQGRASSALREGSTRLKYALSWPV